MDVWQDGQDRQVLGHWSGQGDRAGRLVSVNNQYRFMPIYRKTKERIATGAFGPPFLISGWQQMFHPPSFEKNWRAPLSKRVID